MKTLHKILLFLRGLLPHLVISLSVVLLSLFILDRFNRAMNFIVNGQTKGMLVVYCLLVLTQALLFVFDRTPRWAKMLFCLSAGAAIAVFLSVVTAHLSSTAAKYALGISTVLNIFVSILFAIRRRYSKR